MRACGCAYVCRQHDRSLRIKLPDALTAPSVPAMSYGTTVSGVRPSGGSGPQTTVELMARSGLKYVHATSKGRQGLDGDLEKSRKQVREGAEEGANCWSNRRES